VHETFHALFLSGTTRRPSEDRNGVADDTHMPTWIVGLQIDTDGAHTERADCSTMIEGNPWHTNG
jgi:hypothetical protein